MAHQPFTLHDLYRLRHLRSDAALLAIDAQVAQHKAQLADAELSAAIRRSIAEEGKDPLLVGTLCYGCGLFKPGQPKRAPDGRPLPAAPCDACEAAQKEASTPSAPEAEHAAPKVRYLPPKVAEPDTLPGPVSPEPQPPAEATPASV